MQQDDRLLTSEEFFSMAEQGQLLVTGRVRPTYNGYVVNGTRHDGGDFYATVFKQDTLRLQRILNAQSQSQLNIQEENK